jgi:ABC-type nickel/cobalt efflux system permease component RcnA
MILKEGKFSEMNIGLFVLLILILILGAWAVYRQWVYQRLLNQEQDPVVKTKIDAYRPIFQEKQSLILLVMNCLLVLSLAYSVSSLFNVENALAQLQKITQTEAHSQEKKIQALEQRLSKVTGTSASSQQSTDPSSTQKESKKSSTQASTASKTSEAASSTKDQKSTTEQKEAPFSLPSSPSMGK